jgi:signal transduction histidine kinase
LGFFQNALILNFLKRGEDPKIACRETGITGKPLRRVRAWRHGAGVLLADRRSVAGRRFGWSAGVDDRRAGPQSARREGCPPLSGPYPRTGHVPGASAGQRVRLEISTRLIEQAGKIVEIEGTARDITERKRLEREILEISNREQRRIGHDLHDGVCQQLAGIALMAASLADKLEEKGMPESAQTERISGPIVSVTGSTSG